MVSGVILDGADILISLCAAEIGFSNVAGEERRLRAEQKKIARDFLFLGSEIEGDGRFPGVEMRKQLVNHRRFSLRALRSGPHFLLQTIMAFLERPEIGQDQLRIDHLDVADRVNRAADVMDIGILETTHDLDDRVYFADVAEKLVAEAFARARTFHQARDIDELDRGRNYFLRMRKLCQNVKARVRNGHDSEVWIDRAKRVVGRLRFSGAGNGVEERGFPDVRQPDDPSAQHGERMKDEG